MPIDPQSLYTTERLSPEELRAMYARRNEYFEGPDKSKWLVQNVKPAEENFRYDLYSDDEKRMAKLYERALKGEVPMKEYFAEKTKVFPEDVKTGDGGMTYKYRPWEVMPETTNYERFRELTGAPETKFDWTGPGEEERAEINEAGRIGSDAWHRKQNQEGMWAPDYQWTINKGYDDLKTVTGPVDTEWLKKVQERSPNKLPIPQPQSLGYANAMEEKFPIPASATQPVSARMQGIYNAGLARNPLNQPAAIVQQPSSGVNFGAETPGQRQSYSWSGPQITLPAAITNQLPKTLVPTQGAEPTTYAPQAASTAPSSQSTFEPPKSVPIPDLAQLQSGTPQANNLFSTINGLQNRSVSTKPKTSGFYGGFY